MAENNAINLPKSLIALNGANSDITSLLGLTGTLRAPTNISSSAGLNLMAFSYTSLAVNYLTAYNNATNESPGFIATGSDSAIDITLQSKNGNINLADATATIAPALRLFEADGGNYIAHKAPTTLATNTTYEWPIDGTAAQVLATNASGILSWVTRLLGAGYVTFTRDISTATGTQAVTGVGFKPKTLVIVGNVSGATSGYTSFGMGGASAGLGNGSVFINTTWNNSATNIVSLIDSTGVNQAVATIQSLDSDGFTLSWTKTASPTGTARLFAFCIG